ncbi:glutathione peroxidase [Jiulongibacter sp. NS-SX5]|uniref:glutathione peroxidase n=1 Tax=Jiulongibacter sp. NS-SX5 TaxID=3463854 RepID=UPI00405A4302
MKLLSAGLIALVSVLIFSNFREIEEVSSNNSTTQKMVKGSLYDFKMTSLDGQEIDLAEYKGKKVVILNVASKCGYTPQYADWQKFHEENGDKVAVLGFPANNFGGQEPGSDEEIATFCEKNYGVSFQMFSKIEVKGADQHPLYQWLSKKELNGLIDQAPSWNFCKYVVNESGEVTHFFASGVKPENPEFMAAVGL